eukprot:IDg19551t1
MQKEFIAVIAEGIDTLHGSDRRESGGFRSTDFVSKEVYRVYQTKLAMLAHQDPRYHPSHNALRLLNSDILLESSDSREQYERIVATAMKNGLPVPRWGPFRYHNALFGLPQYKHTALP